MPVIKDRKRSADISQLLTVQVCGFDSAAPSEKSCNSCCTMYKSIALNQHWALLFTIYVLLAMTFLSINLENVSANAVTPEIPAVSDNENDFMITTDDNDEYGSDLYSPLVFFANPAAMEELTNNDNGGLSSDSIFNQKRGWKKMNVAWGKRRNAGQYMNRDFVPSASAAGSWGKREPNWNNLKGMWGKRSMINEMSPKRATNKGDQWNSLRGSWGKREAN